MMRVLCRASLTIDSAGHRPTSIIVTIANLDRVSLIERAINKRASGPPINEIARLIVNIASAGDTQAPSVDFPCLDILETVCCASRSIPSKSNLVSAPHDNEETCGARCRHKCKSP